jgi:hypothetical protein
MDALGGSYQGKGKRRAVRHRFLSRVNGENPTVQSAASFYVPDSSSDVKPPETSRYDDSDDMLAGFSASR